MTDAAWALSYRRSHLILTVTFRDAIITSILLMRTPTLSLTAGNKVGIHPGLSLSKAGAVPLCQPAPWVRMTQGWTWGGVVQT